MNKMVGETNKWREVKGLIKYSGSRSASVSTSESKTLYNNISFSFFAPSKNSETSVNCL